MLYCGALPESSEDFDFLRKAGVKTVITVDRAKPDETKADSMGLRYVRIPIGYDGIPKKAALDFLKLLRTPEIQGPYYLHCHGGKYRSGAMAAIYRIGVNHWSNDSALAEMTHYAGDEKYLGLIKSVQKFKSPSEKDLVKYKYDPNAPIPAMPLADQMGDIQRLWKALQKLAKSGDEKDEMKGMAIGLQEHFAEIYRLKTCEKCDMQGFKALQEMSTQFQLMQKTLDFSPGTLAKVEEGCTSCHKRLRD